MKTTVFDLKCANNCGKSILHVEYSGDLTLRVRMADMLLKEKENFVGCFCDTCINREYEMENLIRGQA